MMDVRFGIFSSREISVVSKGLGDAERVIDPTGLVVASGGIIDRHAHGRLIPAYRMQVFDGVTTTLDLVAGRSADANAWTLSDPLLALASPSGRHLHFSLGDKA